MLAHRSSILLVACLCGLVAAPVRSALADSTTRDVTQLIEQLGSDDYFVRERAQSELAELGFEAFEALSAARTHDDVEVAVRARHLLRLMQIRWSVAEDPPHVVRLLEGYGEANDSERRRAIDALANYDDLGAVEALCRIVRFDDSELRSKHAARRLIERAPQEPGDRSSWSQQVESALGPSGRTAAQWVRIEAGLVDEPDRAADTWRQQLEAELALWQEWPGESGPQVLNFLCDVWLAQLDAEQDHDVVEEALRIKLRFEPGRPDSLEDRIEEFTHYRAWQALDELVEKYRARLNSDAVLLYLLADAKRQQGATEVADQLHAKATSVYPADANSLAHKQVAERLRDRGRFESAEKEFRAALAARGDESLTNPVLEASWMLAYMLHDLERHEPAAEVLTNLIAEIEEQTGGRRGGSRIFHARREFYLACAAEAEGDRAAQLEHLEKVLEQNGLDVDALIALYHYPDLDEARKDDVLRRIHQASEQFRAEISQAQANPKQATSVLAVEYNQLAWLIANTTGDFEEALDASRRSLEIDPRNAGYMDTLARCYFALDDLERAVKYQTWACTIEPHSGQMQRQLDFFRQQLAQRRGTAEDG